MDYTFPNMVVTFDGSQSEICVTLLTTDDSIYEFDETFDLQLSTGSMAVSLSTAVATVTINDDDIGSYVFLVLPSLSRDGPYCVYVVF